MAIGKQQLEQYQSDQFRLQIWYTLDNDLTESAVFAAERLVTEQPDNIANVHLYALCLYRAHKYKLAMHLTNEKDHVGCAYVFGLCCLKLGKYRMGCRALEKVRRIWPQAGVQIYDHSDTRRGSSPDLAAIQCLLGHLYRLFGDGKEAAECYSAALSINPFLWEALEGLCKLGVKLHISNIYTVTPAMLNARSKWPVRLERSTPSYDPFTDSKSTDINSSKIINNALQSRFRQHGDTASDADGDVSMGIASAATPDTDFVTTRGVRTRTRSGQSQPQVPDAPKRTHSIRSSESGQTANATELRRQQSEYTRRSARLLHSDSTPTASTNMNGNSSLQTPVARQGANVPAVQQDVHPLRGRLRAVGLMRSRFPSSTTGSTDETRTANAHESPVSVSANSTATTIERDDEDEFQKAVIDSDRIDMEARMLSLYEMIANGIYALSKFECSSALKFFSSLSQEQQMSPYALGKIGRAYFESVQYSEAETAFRKLRQISPMRLEDMEIYSTLLWHMRKEVQIGFLAHELLDIERNSVQTWIAIGNSFSLQKDHDQALKCFRRAAQIDPTFAYSYTLQGHEYVANEEHGNAKMAYRLAMRADWRHYNAWYGLGMLFLKTGELGLAEQHFTQAALINPGNSVLISCIAMVLEKLGMYPEALIQYDRAIELHPASAMPRFKKARLLMTMRQFDACLSELQVVLSLAPDESSVHFLLGRLFKARGEKQTAIKYFTSALNLDPKASHVIKAAIEGLENEDDVI
ncbi:uncharacterized protein V1516DRAFT_645187 [Lipomyces oligophaga]|uniref:uncharacterized protein n=1 Tax=Lipomyces oligophaga TaxID=45792 RepID=UPI0034CDE695